MKSVVWWVVVGCMSLATATDAMAGDGDGVRLVYVLEEGTESCPSELSVRADVFALLGSDPFDDEGPQAIECRVAPIHDGFEAQLTMTDGDGVVVGKRSIRASGGDCADLGRAVGLTLAMVARRPQDFFDEPEPAEAEAKAEPAPAELEAMDETRTLDPTAARSPAPRERSSPLAGFVLAGAGAGVDSDVRLGGSLYVGGGVRRGPASIELELRLETPHSAELEGNSSVSAATGAVVVAPCYHVSSWSGCALAVGGWVRGRGHNLAMSRSGISPHLGVGARAGWSPRLARRVDLRVFLELEAALSRTRLLVDDSAVWESPEAQLGLGVAAVADFL